ncbi:MAG: type 4a pilus biogenesis protein PilO [Chitinivorax sp.]
MTLDELRQLDPKQIGSWPLPVQLTVLLVIMALLIAAGYFQIWSPQLEQIDAGKQKEEELKKVFLDKKAKAVNLDAYKQQLLEIEQSFGAMLKQLPKKSEVDALLTEINQVGLGRGLQFQLFKPGAEELKTETAELPVTIKIAGSYHDLSAFVSDVAQLSRIVTLGDVSVEPDKEFGMLLSTTARTYRYLDPEEALAVKKANKDKKAGQK